MPESRRLFPRMTVEDNLQMGGFMPAARPKFRERLDVVYALFPRLRERRRQLAGSMSGGEQQMCAIGRALMSEPAAAPARRAVGRARAGHRASRCSTW